MMQTTLIAPQKTQILKIVRFFLLAYLISWSIWSLLIFFPETMGDMYFLANYTAGLRVLDISGIENSEVSEVGFFDTYPANNATVFNGLWSIYPYFESGKLVLGDIDSGLFVVQKSP